MAYIIQPYRAIQFGEYEKVLYLLVAHGFVLRKSLLCSVRSLTQVKDIIGRALRNGHIREFSIATKVNSRRRELKGYCITPLGLDYLRHVTPPADQPEIGWINSMDLAEKVYLRDSKHLSTKSLVRFLNVSTASVFMSGVGASIWETFAEECDQTVAEERVDEEQDEYDWIDDWMNGRMEDRNQNSDRSAEELTEEIWATGERQRAGRQSGEDLVYIPVDEFREDMSKPGNYTKEKRLISVIVRDAKCKYFGENDFRNVPVLNASSEIKFYNSHIVKRTLAIRGQNPYEYRRDRMAGIVVSPEKAALVYTAQQGEICWRPWSYRHELRSFFHFVRLYSDYRNMNDIRNIGIVLVGSPKDLEKIYRPYLSAYEERLGSKGNRIELGAGMDQFVVVPVDHYGRDNCNQYLMCDVIDELQEITQYMIKEGFGRGPTMYRHIFPLQHLDGSYLFIGLYMDIVRINMLLQYQYKEKHPFGIACYSWQRPYYQRLFPYAYYVFISRV